jgi:hypothetical protein
MKIFGKVLDSRSEPLSLANITIMTGDRAKKMGTTADLDGNFSLEDEIISPDSEFKISYIGYEPQTLNASDLQGAKVVLKDSVEVLNEVVIGGGKKPLNSNNSNQSIQSNKQKFVQHLQEHKFVYAGIGGLAGLILITRAFKK